MQRLLNILFWAVIAAAFIGPGTVTTAAASGSRFGFSLLWALVFSTIACLVLQEASARVTVCSGNSLAAAIRERFHGGPTGWGVLFLVLGAIVLGCAAYEAGNVLGGVAGVTLESGLSTNVVTLLLGFLAGLLLFFGTIVGVARVLGVVVAIMGGAFLVTAILMRPHLGDVVKGMIWPTLPGGAGLLALGLIGTTVVPYNLFLGSGIAAGQTLRELRWGLAVAIILGGVISMGILVVGTSVTGEFSFEALSNSLTTRLGGWAGVFFAIGLFAAGFSSAITAPLAAAVTARGLFGRERWHERSWRFRGVWAGVLVTGIIFGVTGIRPIPAIILAQALNGLLLPFAAVFLFLIVNDPRTMGREGLNGSFSNALTALIVVVTIVLGSTKIVSAVTPVLGLPQPGELTSLVGSLALALILITLVVVRVRKQRRFPEGAYENER